MQNEKYKISFGGWYQRTTLHLTEIYDFFAFASSELDLSKQELKKLKELLDLVEVTREVGYLEYVKAKTSNNINIRYYEDGLYILEMFSDDVAGAKKILEEYYDKILSPALSYIFSLGAPTPKILANIKTTHPTAVALAHENPTSYKMDIEKFGGIYNKIISEEVVLYKTADYIFVISRPGLEEATTVLVETQIFFREFKDQLQKYLNIHRKLWEEISDIKEKKSIKGTEVELVRSRLDSYQKTINLISNRINQMGSYVGTRSAISKNYKIDKYLLELFQFKFEALSDTLDYIKEIWKMTTEYLMSAIQNITEIKNQSATRSIQSLQLITSLGVVAGIIGYLSKNELPKITAIGAAYFALIIIITWFVNYSVSKAYKRKKYNLQISERLKDI
jgi:uncharacterized membrane protein